MEIACYLNGVKQPDPASGDKKSMMMYFGLIDNSMALVKDSKDQADQGHLLCPVDFAIDLAASFTIAPTDPNYAKE